MKEIISVARSEECKVRPLQLVSLHRFVQPLGNYNKTKTEKEMGRKKLLENTRVVTVQCCHSYRFTHTDTRRKKGVTKSAVLMAVS
jgi:hypothetical protein